VDCVPNPLILRKSGSAGNLTWELWIFIIFVIRKESIVPFHRKGDKTGCINYCGLSLLSTSYRILSNILLSRLGPYIDESIDYQCGF
jgi:hypothetical protein